VISVYEGMNEPLHNWQEAYRRTLIEEDRGKLTERVREAEEAIYARLLELRSSWAHERERAEILEAAIYLLKLKTEKLGWPHPFRRAGAGG
jgi:hypothetical protein